MNILLWILQVYVAILFTYSGMMKATQNREHLVRIGQTGVEHLSYPQIRSIAIIELLGIVGLILPWALQVYPVLTPMAALGFAVTMIIAARIHYKRGEYKAVVGINLSTFLICVFIAIFRFKSLQ